MLPKPEKIKKNAPTAEQPDLFDSVDQAVKIKHKRRFIIISLILTVGLSVGFSVYRSSKTFLTTHRFSDIKFDFSFKLPELQMSNLEPGSGNLDKDINQIISRDSNSWSIYVKNISPTKTPFNFSKNWQESEYDFDQLTNDLSQTQFVKNSLIQTSLPQGAQIQEVLRQRNNFLEMAYLITIPKQQILMIFQINGQKSDESKQLVSKLADKFYWNIVQNE
jgi:hypothetical protein